MTILQNLTENYYKVWQVLQSATRSYYKVCRVLQSTTIITKWDVTSQGQSDQQSIIKEQTARISAFNVFP